MMNLAKIFKTEKKVSSVEIQAEIDSVIATKTEKTAEIEAVKKDLQNKRVDAMCGEKSPN